MWTSGASRVRHPLSTPVCSGGFREWLECAVAVGGVGGFVVEEAVLEAVPEDLEPAVAECAECGVVALTGGALLVVELARPWRGAQAAEAPRPLIDARAPKRQSANAESKAVQSSQIWPARHPPREAPTRAQRRDLKAAERRWSATAEQALVRYGVLNAEATRSAPGKGWKLNRSNPRSLLKCTRVPVAGLSPFGGTATAG